MTLTTLPSASAMQLGSLGSCLTRSHSKYPLGLSTSAWRSPSARTGIPPAASICIIKDVPERGRPETIEIMALEENIVGQTSPLTALDYLDYKVCGRTQVIQESNSRRSATEVDSVPRGIDGPIAIASPWFSNQARNDDCSALGSLCWFSQL